MYDAIVIGARHNGLAAAVHLAAKGWKVAVVEQAQQAGGAVKTREVTLPGFRHDLFAMNLSMFAGSPFFAAYRDRLFANGLGLAGVSDCFSSAFPDGSWIGVSSDLDATVERIAALSPRDADAWRKMVGDFAGDAPPIFGLLGSPMPSWAAAKTLWNAYREKGRALAWRSRPARPVVAARISRRPLRERQIEAHDGSLGHASRLCPRHRGRRAFSLSGIDGQPEFRYGAPPLDLERENPNLIGGDSHSGSHHLDQNFIFRPVFGWSRYKTPVKGLYLCGASTWPGAGTPGFMLAKMLAGAPG